MKKIIYLLLCLFVLVALCACREYNHNESTQAPSSTTASAIETHTTLPQVSMVSNIEISFYSSNEEAGYITGSAEQLLKSGEATSFVCASARLNYKFVQWSDGVKTAGRGGEVFTSDKRISAIFEYIGFACIYVTDEHYLSTEYSAGSVSVTNAPPEYEINNLGMQIKCRGNFSAYFDKPSYKIKFDNKINLLGMGKGARRDWILISNHCDQSLMRNYFAFNLATRFDNIDITYSATQVNLYVNGEYVGVYLLTEQVEVNDTRVSIDTTLEDVNIGFLIELDRRREGIFNVDYIEVYGMYFAIKSDYTTRSQRDYLREYLNDCVYALRSGDYDSANKLIDLDSFVDMYILQEYVKNIDVGWSSFFMYMPEYGGKLYCGPAWDFDLAMGNDERLDAGSYEGIYVGENRWMRQSNMLYIYAMQHEWFQTLVKNRWQELKPIIKQMIADMKDYTALNFKELEENFVKWDIFGQRLNQEPYQIMLLDSYTAHFDYLIDWLENRYTWLDNYFA